MSKWVSLETMVLGGIAAVLAGLGILVAVFIYWSAHSFVAIDDVLPPIIGTSLLAIGAQNIFGGFLLSVVGGNEARFFDKPGKLVGADEFLHRSPR